MTTAFGHGHLRACANRKKSYVDPEAAEFLQTFINDMVKAMVAPPGLLPEDITCIMCPSPWKAGKDNLHPLPMTSNLLFNTSEVFTDDPVSCVVKSTWRAIATGAGNGRANMSLHTGTVDSCQLGDLIVFLLSEVPLLACGVCFAIGRSLLRHFANLLQSELPRIVPLQPKAACVAALRGCCGRSFRLDPRRLVMAMDDISKGQSSGLGAWSRKQETVDHDAAKLLVWAYNRKACQEMDHPNQTLVLMSDGAKGSGEGMNLYFSYSPVINLGAWLPFQVTCPPHNTARQHKSNSCCVALTCQPLLLTKQWLHTQLPSASIAGPWAASCFLLPSDSFAFGSQALSALLGEGGGHSWPQRPLLSFTGAGLITYSELLNHQPWKTRSPHLVNIVSPTLTTHQYVEAIDRQPPCQAGCPSLSNGRSS